MFSNPITGAKRRLESLFESRDGWARVQPAYEPPPLPNSRSTVSRREWRYLQPRELDGLKNLLFEARRIVEGVYAGRHRSPFKGSTLEFADYRQYYPGDDVRTVDWKVFARTDRYFIRRFEQDTNLACSILLDASGSMAYRGAGQAGRTRQSKFDYAAHLCAALAFLILRQGDSAGLTLFDQSVRSHIPPSGRFPHLYTILQSLENTKPGRRTSLAASLRKTHSLVRRRGLLVIVSDLLDDPETVLKSLALFTHRGFEILVFHILHEDEVRLPPIDSANFFDAESGGELTCAPEDLRQGYTERIEAFRDDWMRRARSRGIGYQFVTTDTPYAAALEHYLVRRNKG